MSIGIESQTQTQQSEQARPARRNYAAYSEGGYRPGEMDVPEHDDLSFGDVLDIVNPLQHIPGVNMAYRALTGDQMEAPARILGGMIYGGPVGFVSGIANSLLEEGTGRDIGETVIAQVLGEDALPDGASGEQHAAKPNDAPTAAAANAPAQMTQDSRTARHSDERTNAASESTGLTGMDALRAFASDQGTPASPASAPQSSQLPEDEEKGDYYALNPSAQPPTTAATTSGSYDERRPGEIQQAQAPQSQASQSQTSQSAPSRSGSGSPPPDDSFMPLGNGNGRVRTAANAERMPLTDSMSGPAAGPSMSAGSMSGGEKTGLPGAAMNAMPGKPADSSRPAPAAPGLSPQGEGAPNAAAYGPASGGGQVAEQMKAALLKYQALQEE